MRARWLMTSGTGLLGTLPRPGGARRGWPWTTESAPPPPLRPDGTAWPRISVVTPSYNQGCYLEETIRSVLLQNYPNLEYRIVDGGSVDGSVAIVKSYGSLLSGWVSEPDHGQAAAIEKGFRTATGDLLCWLNSDDFLLPGALLRVAQHFIAAPGREWAVGGGVVVDEQGRLIEKRYPFPQRFESLLFLGQFFPQMSAFWTRDAHRGVGGLDDGLHFCFDYDFFLKLARRSAPGRINALLSAFRLHGASKTSTIFEETAVPECRLVRERHGYETWPEAVRQLKEADHRRSFHRNKRRGELRGAFSDPRYFGRQVLRYLGVAAGPLRRGDRP